MRLRRFGRSREQRLAAGRSPSTNRPRLGEPQNSPPGDVRARRTLLLPAPYARADSGPERSRLREVPAEGESSRMVHISVKRDLLELDTSPLPETT